MLLKGWWNARKLLVMMMLMSTMMTTTPVANSLCKKSFPFLTKHLRQNKPSEPPTQFFNHTLFGFEAFIGVRYVGLNGRDPEKISGGTELFWLTSKQSISLCGCGTFGCCCFLEEFKCVLTPLPVFKRCVVLLLFPTFGAFHNCCFFTEIIMNVSRNAYLPSLAFRRIFLALRVSSFAFRGLLLMWYQPTACCTTS